MTLQVHERTPEFVDTFISHPERSVERLDRGIRFEDDFDVLGALASEIMEGSIPILFGNHQSYADGLVLSRVTELLVDATELEGFRIPGSAGSTSQPLHEALTPIYETRGLFPIGVYTDVEIATIAASHPEERPSNMRAAAKLASGPKQNYGLSLFPEADPIGGSTDENGTVLGMQQVIRNDLANYASIFSKKYPGRDVLFVPVAIDGSHHIYKPETNTPGEPAIKAVCDNEINDFFVELKVGELIPVDEITGDYNTFLMSAVAKLLPEPARGYYA